MLRDSRLDAAQRSLQLAQAMRRAASEIDAQVAPGLSADLVRTAGLIAFSVGKCAALGHDHAGRKYLAAALSAVDELETLLNMATGLELLGTRGPKLVAELQQIRELLRTQKRDRHGQRGGNAA